MKSTPPSQEPHTPLILTPRHEQILKAIHEYRYATAQDMTHLLFSKGSLAYVRRQMSALAGGKDQQARHYLYRFPFPTGAAGNRERIFTLGARGRDFLATVLGLPVDWYFRPSKSDHLSHSHVLHHLLLTRFVVAASAHTHNHPQISLLQSRLCHELARNQVVNTGKKQRKPTKPVIIPDAWLLFALQSTGARYPVLLEIDRGTEYSAKFKAQTKARLEFIRSGEYTRMFPDNPAVIVAYVTAGTSPAHAQTRVKTMASWTQTVLSELDLQEWGVIFRFTSISFDTFYEDIPSLLEQPVWYRPDTSQPVRLFG
jgi:Replication-relaxation